MWLSLRGYRIVGVEVLIKAARIWDKYQRTKWSNWDSDCAATKMASSRVFLTMGVIGTVVIGTKAGVEQDCWKYGGCGKRDRCAERIIVVDVEMTNDDWSHGGHGNLEETKACRSLAPRDHEIPLGSWVGGSLFGNCFLFLLKDSQLHLW